MQYSSNQKALLIRAYYPGGTPTDLLSSKQRGDTVHCKAWFKIKGLAAQCGKQDREEKYKSFSGL